MTNEELASLTQPWNTVASGNLSGTDALSKLALEVDRRGQAVAELHAENERLKSLLRDCLADEDDEVAMEIRGWFIRREKAVDAARAALSPKGGET